MVSSPGTYWSMRGKAASGTMTYFEMAAFDSGTRVKILPESKSRFLSFIRARMPGSEDKATA